MISRRHFTAALLAAFATPVLGQTDGRAVDALRRTARGLKQLHAIMVQRGDEIVLAEAPRGRGLDRPANIKSCSKSIVGLLLGTAIAQKEITSVRASLRDVAPGLIPASATPGAEAITMEDLVTLRAGLGSTSGGNYGSWVQSRNWVAAALSRPMIDRPGGNMIYSTGSTHILGAAIATATKKTLLQLARERLGGPLTIEIPAWTRDPQGFYFGGNEMALSPRAMLRLALLMRDRGRFGAAQVIPASWMEASLVRRTQSPYSGLDYGYGWFLSSSGFIIARGYGGQIIAAHPQARLAVAITSDPTLPARSLGHFGDLMALLEGPILALA